MSNKKELKVAIVAELLVKMGGAERVVKKFSQMYPEADIFTLLYDEQKCGRDFPKEKVKSSFLQRMPFFLRKRYRWFLAMMPWAIESFDLSSYDLVISSSSAFAHGALTGSESLHVCYCHSPMRYAWDYTHDYLKEGWFNPLKSWLAKSTLENIRVWDKIAADRPDFYLANSKHVLKRIEKYYRLPAEVIYPPVDVDRFSCKGEKGDYFLIISTLAAYKRVDLAVNLFNKIGKKLVIIGEGPERVMLESLAGDNIEFKGRLSDEECTRYLENCRAFIFPSEEDFGITMIEAMACGKPVLAYAAGGAIETVKPGFSGELFRDQTIEGMEDALGRLIINEHKYNPEKIRESVLDYSANIFEKKIRSFVDKKFTELRKQQERS